MGLGLLDRWGWLLLAAGVVLAVVLMFWWLRRAWMSDEYRGVRRRPHRLESHMFDPGTGEYPKIIPRRVGRHQKNGRADDLTRALDLSNVHAGRAQVPPWSR